MSILAVIFDLDGTITRPTLDFDEIRRQIGLSADCGSILTAIERMPADRQAQAIKILHDHEEHAAIHSSLNPGAPDVLSKLRKRALPLGILSRNSRKSIDTVLSKHKLSFDMILSREDGPAKPDAYGIHKFCEFVGVRADQVLLVGDYMDDLLTAHNAGAVSVLMKTHKNADVFEKNADFTIDHLDELLEIIDNSNVQKKD